MALHVDFAEDVGLPFGETRPSGLGIADAHGDVNSRPLTFRLALDPTDHRFRDLYSNLRSRTQARPLVAPFETMIRSAVMPYRNCGGLALSNPPPHALSSSNKTPH